MSEMPIVNHFLVNSKVKLYSSRPQVQAQEQSKRWTTETDDLVLHKVDSHMMAFGSIHPCRLYSHYGPKESSSKLNMKTPAS